MSILVTGAAGFIGYHAVRKLLTRGASVVGVDNLNNYYDFKLKEARLHQLESLKSEGSFVFHKMSIADNGAMVGLGQRYPGITHILHLAAQAGVRYSLENPQAYAESNLTGHLNMLELARHTPKLKHFVYASSSSVYGANTKVPFSVKDAVDHPVSLYAATKRSGELLAESYARLYGFPATGLRYFTVYGPWGRPDMAYFSFTKAILAERPITLFNNGEMRRDFTYIDDIVDGTLAALDKPATGSPPHKLYNLGHHKPETLSIFVAAIEKATGKSARIEKAPMQPGDVKETYAEISESARDLSFTPRTSLNEGIAHFVEWYRSYYKM